jgi:hypothetical protein
LTNQFTAGANVALGTNKDSIFVRSVFGRASDIKLSGHKFQGNMEVSTADNTFCGEVSMDACCSKKGVSTRAVLNSEADGELAYIYSSFSKSCNDFFSSLKCHESHRCQLTFFHHLE